MKILNIEQGSPEWLQARLGIPTASCFSKLLTATGKPSTQADGYANTLIAEMLCGQPVESFSSDWMERGKELEPEARAYYTMQTGLEVPEIGFVLRDDGRVGCSPDGLPSDGLVEIKCPAPHTHVSYLLTGEVPKTYFPQVQGQMWITERNWCDFLSYHPLMPPVLVRVERDDKYIKKLETEVTKLLGMIDERMESLKKQGIEPVEQAA